MDAQHVFYKIHSIAKLQTTAFHIFRSHFHLAWHISRVKSQEQKTSWDSGGISVPDDLIEEYGCPTCVLQDSLDCKTPNHCLSYFPKPFSFGMAFFESEKPRPKNELGFWWNFCSR